jgi:hypothetical protein
MHDIQKFHISTPPYVSSDYHVAVPEPDREGSIGPGFQNPIFIIIETRINTMKPILNPFHYSYIDILFGFVWVIERKNSLFAYTGRREHLESWR